MSTILTATRPVHYSIPGLLRLDLSAFRKVFVCGDIHGCFPLLDQALIEAGYNASHDALLSVGDLVDRGPHSAMARGFLARPNVWAVCGNHENMLVDAWLHPDDDVPVGNFINNGGRWFAALKPEDQLAIGQALCGLPIAIEAKTPGGRTIGIVHAAVPGDDWQNVRDLPAEIGIDANAHPSNRSDAQAAAEVMTWDRRGVQDAARFIQLGHDPAEFPPVANIDHVFHGHNILRRPMQAGNTTWLDTGAFHSGVITVVDADAAALP